EIHLDFRPSTFYLEVRDNGRGMSPNAVAEAHNRGHFGLDGMQNRASVMGGRCEVRPRPGGGTVVALDVPMCAPNAEDAGLAAVYLEGVIGSIRAIPRTPRRAPSP